ncbi:MAG: radical SAM protein, partial [Pseudoalteromonas sp.]|uniref:viperin family antiviral radical SAM protein n=1 Tax=Pseudoalteromonas sp. TaxID=53249 RepID=UPI001D321FED
VRINFAGGEPLILKKRFAQLIMKAKSLGFNLSLITNGHYLTNSFINNYGAMFSMIGISFDSQYMITREDIGRIDRKDESFGTHVLIKAVKQLRKVNPSITIKINTVVNSLNYQESFEQLIAEIKPEKWKVFQVLPVLNDNLLISDEQFTVFVNRHASLKEVMVAEDNEAMTTSYLMINPQGRFYQNSSTQNGYIYGDLILDVGVEKALEVCQINWETFASRYKKDNTISLISNSEYQLKNKQNNIALKQGV